MALRRRSTQILIAITTALTVVLLTAAPALADTAFGWKRSGCDYSDSGSRFKLKTRVTAWDYGQTVKVPGGKNTDDEFWNTGYLKTYDCDGFLTSEKVDFRWTITAHGWQISCGAGLPPGVSCTGTSSARTLVIADFTGTTGSDGVLQRALAAGSPAFFEDGLIGDTNKTCSTLAITSYAGAGERMTVSACADNG
jgi:hypothetical protein